MTIRDSVPLPIYMLLPLAMPCVLGGFASPHVRAHCLSQHTDAEGL